jgi:hypothetical protein
MSRDKAPVFVVGCPRSGTTLLYNMLLSAGNFAVYLAESNVFNLLVPRFGDLSSRVNRERLMDAWLDSKLFRASFLDRNLIRAKVLEECRSGADFIRIVMGEMARQQGMSRWADNSPEELLHMKRIKREIPDALFVHMIRDGRDVSLSLDARPYPWIRPFASDRKNSLLVTGLFWQWIVNKGRAQKRHLGDDYLEIHFEDLNAEPQVTLDRLGQFIGQELNYQRILRAGVGSVSEPNTSFKGDKNGPVGRWTKKMSPGQLADFEALVGHTLKELGYPIAATASGSSSVELARMRTLYGAYFESKFWFKNSAFGRAYLGPMSGAEIDRTAIATDPARQVVGASKG